jgi:hypothetical protein
MAEEIRVDGTTYEMAYGDPDSHDVLVPAHGLDGLVIQQMKTGGWYFVVIHEDYLEGLASVARAVRTAGLGGSGALQDRHAAAREVAIELTPAAGMPLSDCRVEYLKSGCDIVVSNHDNWRKPAYLVRVKLAMNKMKSASSGCALAVLAATLTAALLFFGVAGFLLRHGPISG